MKKAPSRWAFRAVVPVVLAAGVTACSSPGEFTVSEACGAKVDSGLVGPLLPEGEELEVEERDGDPGQSRCEFTVDGKPSLHLSGDVVEPDFDPLKASEDGLRRLGDPKPADIGDAARIADHGATAVRACTYKGERRQFVMAFDGVDTPKDTAERRKAIEAFARSQLPNALKAHGCEPTA